MATQNRTTKPQPTQGSAAARQAAQAPAADAAKMAKQAADKAELDKQAQAKQDEARKAVVAETAAEGSVATTDTAAAAEGSLGSVSGEAAVAEAGAAGAAGTTAAISPLAIGAGVVGVVALAAAAGGGSSGGSSSQPIAQNNTQQAAQNQGSQKPATPAAEQPAQDTKPAEGTNKPAQDAKPAEPAKEEPAKQADSKPADQPKVDPTPVEDLSKPATAGGTAEAPKVAADGVTNLTNFADLFKTAGANGGEAEFIKISRILSAENAKDAQARAVDSDNSRAYEVIDAGRPITLAEAEAMAKQLGGKLMSVDSAAEKAWLDKNLFGALGEYDGDKSLAEAAARGESDKAAQQKVLDGQLASNGAWLGKNATEGADAKANAVIRNGNNADGDGAMKLYEAAGTTLSKFVIEYEGYKSPLLLDGKPVVEGQIINKADAAKLAWNADLNKGGQITYQAVDSNDAATAKPVADAKAGTMTLSESAEVKHPITVPTNPSAQDQPAQGGAAGKPGNDVPQAGQNGQDNQNSNQQPAKPELPATNQGTAEAPQVATTGETKLANIASAFEKSAGEGKNVEFIKIAKIDTSEGEADARVFREVETTVKAPDAADPVKTVSTTAYEVISTKEPITRAQAEEMAKARGGKLLSIDSAEEAKFIGQNLFGTLGEYDSDESVAEVQGDSAKAAQQDVLNGQLAKNGAWLGNDSTAGAVNNADAIIRNGNGKDLPKGYKAYDFSGDKLSRFVIEIENYKAPMTLNGKPVVDGQIINKADFDKLVWNGDHNMGGKITYVAVQSNEANAAKVEGAEEKTLTVTESATITHPSAPASNPAQNQQQGGAGTPEVQDNKTPTGGEGHKGDQQADKGGNKAGDPPKGGEHGTDGGNHKADTPQNSTTGGDSNKGNGNPGGQGAAAGGSTGATGAQGGSKPQEGGSDSKAGGTTQDASSQSQGQTPPSKPAGSDPQAGSPSGKPVAPGGQPSDAPSQPAGTPEAQTGGAVNQPAQPPVKAAPSYEANKSVSVAHDETNAKIGKEVFEGTTPDNKPEAVKATGFAQGTLKVNGVAISDGDKIAAENFDKVTWDASKGEGGSFKFTPVQANGDALQGATEQTITINEAPAPVVNAEPKLGVYPTEAVKFDVAHDALKGALTKDSQTSPFAGTNAEKAPDAVKIVSVHGPDGQPTAAEIMTLGDGGTARNLVAGQFIDKADFSNVQWNASVDHGSGTYKVQFVPVTSDHQEIAGAQTQTFTVKEAAEQPDYSGETFKAVAEHNGDATFGKAMFDGTDAAKAPMYIRITEINPTNPEAGDKALYLDNKRSVDLTVDEQNPGKTILAQSDFEHLRWNTAHNEGGTFKFTALDGDMKPIDPNVVHTVTVTEKADATPQAISHQSLFGASEGQGPLTTSAKSLAYTPAEPSSNLLDDLHNQISPLI